MNMVGLIRLALDFLEGVVIEYSFFLKSLKGVFLASLSSVPGRETGDPKRALV